MTFLNFSPTVLAAGAVALAGILYLLHLLRVRYSEVRVPTVLFWLEAVRDAPARVFRERFRHLWAYLLALLICLLIWFGAAGPQWDEDASGDFQLLVLDGSAFAGVDDDFERAKQRLLDDLESYPLQNRAVFLAGSYTVKLLAAGERVEVLRSRLADIEPEMTTGNIDDFLALVSKNQAYETGVTVTLYGRLPLRQETIASLPNWIRVRRAFEVAEVDSNWGIVAAGIGEATSGIWDRVDVFLEVHATDGAQLNSESIEVTELDGAEIVAPLESLGDNRFALRNLQANGSALAFSIVTDDALPLDDVAWLTLPERTVIRVEVADSVPTAVTEVIVSDPGFQLVDEQPDVTVATVEEVAGDTPHLVLVEMTAQENAFEIGYSSGDDSDAFLRRSVSTLGLDQIDSVGIATELQTAITAAVRPAETRTISIWKELIDDRFNFVDSRSFPLFLANSIRWLADEKPWFAYLAAGTPFSAQLMNPNLSSPIASRERLSGTDFSPAKAGPFAVSDTDVHQVSLVNGDVTALEPGTALLPTAGTGATTSEYWGFVSWLILLVLGLLVAEWYLYQRGYIP